MFKTKIENEYFEAYEKSIKLKMNILFYYFFYEYFKADEKSITFKLY